MQVKGLQKQLITKTEIHDLEQGHPESTVASYSHTQRAQVASLALSLLHFDHARYPGWAYMGAEHIVSPTQQGRTRAGSTLWATLNALWVGYHRGLEHWDTTDGQPGDIHFLRSLRLEPLATLSHEAMTRVTERPLINQAIAHATRYIGVIAAGKATAEIAAIDLQERRYTTYALPEPVAESVFTAPPVQRRA